MTPSECIQAIQRTIQEAADLPSSTTFMTEQVDLSNSNRNIRLPLVETQTISQIRIEDFNTDRIGYIRDDEGNRVARVFHTEYMCDFQIDVWTGARSRYDPDEMGRNIREALYVHDKAGPDKPFRDENGDPIDDIWNFRILDGGREDDLTMSPSLQRWRQDVELWAYEEFVSTEDYIEHVILPTDEEITSG